MKLVDYIIHAEYVLTMDESLSDFRQGAAAVKGTTIEAVGHTEDILKSYKASQILNCGNSVLMPGFVNAHSHAPMVYFRGIAEDLSLGEWLEKHIRPAELKFLNPEFVRNAAELACLEMLKAGVTTYNDIYFFSDSSAIAAETLGIRAMLGSGVMDLPSVTGDNSNDYLEKAERFINRWKGSAFVYPCVAPHSILSCSEETLKRSLELAVKLDTPLHIHLSETAEEVKKTVQKFGKRPVEYLDSIGFLNQRVIAAHCVHVDAREIEILAAKKVSVAHCVESNLKLASGIAPAPEMIRAGITVGLGSDGAASNNDLNIMSEMATAAKIHKAISNNPNAINSKTALLMATRWGAEAIGLGESIGSLGKGKKADIISISLDGPHCYPMYDIYSHLVYSAMASDVQNVMVDGKLIIKNRRHSLVNEEAIFNMARHWQDIMVL